MKEVTQVDLSKPSVYNFDEYLPWACNQLQAFFHIAITKIHLNSSLSVQTDRTKLNEKTNHDVLKNLRSVTFVGNSVDIIKINTVYDNTGSLVQIKFSNNKKIPRMVIKVIGLIVQFYPCLTNITINKGLDNSCIHELSNLLSSSNITDICLDNTTISNANYVLLLENMSSLKQLSLSRCNINDDILKNIASDLAYPSPASKFLTVLRLSSNKITDIGAKYLAEALRTNRQLAYLNLADNLITDEGSVAILEVLTEFRVLNEELISSKSRRIDFLKQKTELISRMIVDLQAENIIRKNSMKRKFARSTSSVATISSMKKSKVSNKEPSLTTIKSDDVKSIETSWQDKAKTIVENQLGNFIDPYSLNNKYKKNGQEYCYGNNHLAYLNLAYNDLSYFTVRKLLTVLLKQKLFDRSPRGLVNVSIEGNCIPVNCEELNEIEDLLDASLTVSSGKQSKKRPPKTGK